jgi:hypothetical protein
MNSTLPSRLILCRNTRNLIYIYAYFTEELMVSISIGKHGYFSKVDANVDREKVSNIEK